MDTETKATLNWKEIGQRFRDVRLNRDYTQLQIGEVASQNKGAIAMFEIGAKPASTHYALFLRNEFGISFDWLYEGVENLRSEKDRTTKKALDRKLIGQRLKSLRLGMGLTQKEFGLVVGLTHAGISRIENGIRTPEIKTALKIKRALNKPLDWLYFGDEEIIPNSRKKGRRMPILNSCSKKKSMKV
ncbi:helix-turn-helix transcriptional regulator [Candidatus Liberibacter africanus]|uniref:HTH cro/C1-type domain-containing protein n=1 Tax=Candidatus Liberibacter africanus PTSAPSY TaxID=1277257 RepID=A0A0G3IA13_LIBAF|nr:helix-turn-helix transcriptional regulator [Candidatus Liberibacter africanus]AKK20657.1 hypothetical protein G293_05230 [Candidatus Liberibacter africanus PTSAPSY]QTP64332.1 helix-turn-helix transcriptional regulator [Candidatus Liberibacter africanus]